MGNEGGWGGVRRQRTRANKKRQTNLKGGARQQQARLTFEEAHNLREEALLVFDAVRLVDYEVAPRELAQERLLAYDNFVSCDDDVELTGEESGFH